MLRVVARHVVFPLLRSFCSFLPLSLSEGNIQRHNIITLLHSSIANKEQVDYTRLAQTSTAKPNTTAHSLEVEERADKNSTTDSLHWKNTTMACALLTGLIFALIHHFFHHYWNGKAVVDETQQQRITRGGTFFAFAFKVRPCCRWRGRVCYNALLPPGRLRSRSVGRDHLSDYRLLRSLHQSEDIHQ